MSNERVKKLRANNAALGRKRKEYYLTDSEHAYLKAKLADRRKAAL